MALGPSSWPLIDLVTNTPDMDRNGVGKPPKAELGQVRSGRGFTPISAQGAVISPGPCTVPLGLTGFVSHTHVGQAWLLYSHPLPSGSLLGPEQPSGQQSCSCPRHHTSLPALSGSHTGLGFEGSSKSL